MDRKKEVRELLQAYASRFTEGRPLVQRFEEFCSRYADPLSRQTVEGHLTASAWVINPAGQCYLQFHKKIGRWLQPGGHIEDGETIHQACLREVVEETQLTAPRLLSGEIFDLDIHEIPERESEPVHYHYDIRFLVSGDGPALVNDQSGWFSAEGARQLNSDASVMRMVEKWQRL